MIYANPIISDGLTKKGPGAKKVRGPLFSVFKQSRLSKKKVFILRGDCLMFQNSVISKKSYPVNIFHLAKVGERQFSSSRNVGKMMASKVGPSRVHQNHIFRQH